MKAMGWILMVLSFLGGAAIFAVQAREGRSVVMLGALALDVGLLGLLLGARVAVWALRGRA